MHKEMCHGESWKALEQGRALTLMEHVLECSGERLALRKQRACCLHGPWWRRAGAFTVGWNLTLAGWRCARGHWGVNGLLCPRELLPPSAQPPRREHGGDKNAPLLSAWGAGGRRLREQTSHIPAWPSAWTVGSLRIRTTAWVPLWCRRLWGAAAVGRGPAWRSPWREMRRWPGRWGSWPVSYL